MLPAEEYSEFAVEFLSQGYLADFCGYWVGAHSDWPAAFSDYLSGYEVDGQTVQAWEDFVLNKMPTDERFYARSPSDLCAQSAKGWICPRAVGRRGILSRLSTD